MKSLKMVKNLYFSLIVLLFSSFSLSYELAPYKNVYKAGKNTAIEELILLEDKTWLMKSEIKHSLFKATQEAKFIVENNKVFLQEASRKLRALGGFMRETQSISVNYDLRELEYSFNRKKGKLFFDDYVYETLTLQIQAKLDLFKKTLPLEIEYNFFNKEELKLKTFNFSEDKNEIKFQEVRDDDKGFLIWFLPEKNLISSKILQKGAIKLSWELESKL